MPISKEMILKRRAKLEQQQLKKYEKLKALQQKLRKATHKLLEVEKKEETDRRMIAGRLVLEKIKADPVIQSWLTQALESSSLTPYERSLFGS